MNTSRRVSSRVQFDGGAGFALAGIVDQATECETPSVAIFSHCFTCNKDFKAIVRISRFLAEQGVTVLRFDMTGLGGSEGDFSKTNFSTNVADLHAAAQYATEHFTAPSTLMGISFGGAASLALATPEKIRQSPALRQLSGVVTIAAPSDTQHLAELMLRMNPQIADKGQGSVTIGGKTWNITQQMIDDFQHQKLPDEIAKLAVPLTIFHSPSDATVSFDNALRIHQLASTPSNNRLKPPPVNLITLNYADHLLSDPSADIPYISQMILAFATRYRTPYSSTAL